MAVLESDLMIRDDSIKSALEKLKDSPYRAAIASKAVTLALVDAAAAETDRFAFWLPDERRRSHGGSHRPLQLDSPRSALERITQYRPNGASLITLLAQELDESIGKSASDLGIAAKGFNRAVVQRLTKRVEVGAQRAGVRHMGPPSVSAEGLLAVVSLDAGVVSYGAAPIDGSKATSLARGQREQTELRIGDVLLIDADAAKPAHFSLSTGRSKDDEVWTGIELLHNTAAPLSVIKAFQRTQSVITQ